MRTRNGRVGEQSVQSTNEVHGLSQHLLNDGGAVGHIAQNYGLRTRHQRHFEALVGVAVRTD